MTLVSIVMPTYNEQDHIHDNLLLTASVLDKENYELIAVNDGSTDSTLEEIIRASKKCHRIKVVSYAKNKGKGHAVKKGFEASNGDLIVFFDSDLEIHPKYILTFLEIYKNSRADVIVASIKLSQFSIDRSRLRLMLSRVYFLLVRVFILPLGHEAGLHVYRREVLERVLPQVTTSRYAAEIEQLALCHRMGYRIVEAPVGISSKDKGGMGLFDWLDCGIETFAVWVRLNVLKNTVKK